MPTSAKPKQSEAREFFYLDGGQRADAGLHEDILAEGDDAAARQVSDAVKARILGAKKTAETAGRWRGLRALARKLLRRD